MTTSSWTGGSPLVPTERLRRRNGPGRDISRRSPSGRASEVRAEQAHKLESAIRSRIAGEVLFDDASRGLYAQDASNYFEVPIGVVLPRSREDVIACVSSCREFGVPIVCRTGGTALAGQTCNEAVVIDFSRYMNRILGLDAEARRARVEPGVICDDLVKAAAPHGLTWGPKPATHDRCCFGGMLANNCGGMEAQMAGTAVHNVEALQVLLYDGTILNLGWMTLEEFENARRRPGREGEIYRSLSAFSQRVGSLVRARYPKIPRRVSGYNLDELLPDEEGRINVARALVGTEGTCAVILEATVRLVHRPPHDVVLAAGFRDIFEAADAVPTVVPFEPIVCEGLDQRLIDHIRKKKSRHARYISTLPKGCGWLLVKAGGESAEAAVNCARAIGAALKQHNTACEIRIIENPDDAARIWEVRESGLGATAFVPGEPDTWPGWEDSAVSPDRLGAYLRELDELYTRYGYRPALYGHFGQGLVHCRVAFDLTTPAGIERYKAFAVDAADLCCGKYGGSLSGEHGDGQARGWLLEHMFGSELVQAFSDFKRIWDPDGRMNPGKVVNPKPVDANLRLGSAYQPWNPDTHFRFPEDRGSFSRATLRCVGVGKCRREAADGSEHDVMCPSYMVTHDEKHSTRGRAHLLWEMMRGGPSPIQRDFRNEGVKEALDLCLACKGCKGDCPVNVDIATYKAEFLAHYWQGRLRPRYAYAFGFIDRWARLARFAPGLVNWFTQSPLTAGFAKLAAGMAASRRAPEFAPETFLHWFSHRTVRPSGGQRVVLWPDTFNNHFHPETAQSAVRVLESLGCEVLVPTTPVCCGRPLYDYGFLEQAKRYLGRVLTALAPWLDEGLPIIVLEPSCASVFRDELSNLMPENAQARRLAESTKLLSEFLAELPAPKLLPKLRRTALAHGHCHHKSLFEFDAEQEVFEEMGLRAEVLSSGCCGMAGSFGFERDPLKLEVSRSCAERALLPRVRTAERDAFVIADGFSCRTQIEQETERRALHLADVMALALEHGPDGPPRGEFPEAGLVARRHRALARSRRRTFVIIALAVGALVAWFVFRPHAAEPLGKTAVGASGSALR